MLLVGKYIYIYIHLLLDFDSVLVQGSDFETEGDKPAELLRIKLKTRTQQPVPMRSEHSAHLTSLLELVHPWIWRYPALPKLIRFYIICTSCTLSFRDYISLRLWTMGSRYQRCSFRGEIRDFPFWDRCVFCRKLGWFQFVSTVANGHHTLSPQT